MNASEETYCGVKCVCTVCMCIQEINETFYVGKCKEDRSLNTEKLQNPSDIRKLS